MTSQTPRRPAAAPSSRPFSPPLAKRLRLFACFPWKDFNHSVDVLGLFFFLFLFWKCPRLDSWSFLWFPSAVTQRLRDEGLLFPSRNVDDKIPPTLKKNKKKTNSVAFPLKLPNIPLKKRKKKSAIGGEGEGFVCAGWPPPGPFASFCSKSYELAEPSGGRTTSSPRGSNHPARRGPRLLLCLSPPLPARLSPST